MDKLETSDSDYEDFTNAEDYSQYKLDGYHPVYISEKFKSGKYQIIQKLGWGHFSTVWLIKDTTEDNLYFALKIQKSKANYFEAAKDELELLNELKKKENLELWSKEIEEYNLKLGVKRYLKKDQDFVIKLIDNFVHIGMHGKHPCSILELMGPNLLDVIQYHEINGKIMNIKMIKHITKQILFGLDYMHRICKIIHTDLKPENIMIKLPNDKIDDFLNKLKAYRKKPLSMKFLKFLKTQLGKKPKITSNNEINKTDDDLNKIMNNLTLEKNDGFIEGVLRWKESIMIPLDDNLQIKIVDFGNGCWVNKHFTNNIQTREYRSFEAVIGLEYQANTDIWSLACIIFEMMTNTFLFKPKQTELYDKNDDHLALMIETLGPVPHHLLSQGMYSSKYFDKDASLKRIKNIKEYKIGTILMNEFKYDPKTAKETEEFLVQMLEYDPNKRKSAKELLNSAWLWD